VETATAVAAWWTSPMMMSAFDSVTKRRALVVAASIAAVVEHDHLDRHAGQFLSARKSSALRSGMPSAAAGPVVVTVMPMTISLDCAIEVTRQRQRRRDHRGRQIKLLHSVPPFSVI